MQYEAGAGLVSGGTAAYGRLCGTTDTNPRRARPFTIKKLTGNTRFRARATPPPGHAAKTALGFYR
jgi:hypothetical protein